MTTPTQEEKQAHVSPLENWQSRLESHFSDLSQKRSGINLPVFALEHGLSIQETEELSKLLRKRLVAGERLGKYWLLWVVYATEIGYHYTGQEFWQSFEIQTPGWDPHNRGALKSWFIKFQETFNGYVPEGLWAQHFPIIAWPITHAILPVYLQYHFISSLYTLRFKLAGLKEHNSSTVGHLLSSYTFNATSRYDRFLEQEELAGRITLGLLGLSPNDEQEAISSHTLKRIIADLDKARNLRSWYRDTYDYVDRFKGIRQRKQPDNRTNRNTHGVENRPTNHGLRPKIILRYSPGNKWVPLISVPDFKRVFALAPQTKEFLKCSRCRISGAKDMKPRGWALSGNRISKIQSWPKVEKPIIEFEKKNEILNNILDSDCRMDEGPTWLFKIGSDGIAREVKSRNVRPGSKYILVCLESHENKPSELETECKLDCAGVYGIIITIPDVVSLDDEATLEGLSLKSARTVKVWPAGLPCRNWDGEGTSEWLTTERPTFGMVSDYPVSSYLVRIDNESVLSLQGKKTGEPSFFQVDALSPGKYQLSISAIREASTGKRSETITAYLDVTIRDPEQWVPGTPSHSGMIVNIDPYDAELDELWENKVKISASGPPGYSATFLLKLFNSEQKCVLNKKIGSHFNLPLDPNSWNQQFEQFREEYELQYLESTTAILEVDGDGLGKYKLNFERDVTPLRWITRSVDRDYSLRLIDDTGVIGEPETYSYSMTKPSQRQELNLVDSLNGFSPASPGALTIANHGSHTDSVIVSRFSSVSGFKALGLNPDFSDIRSNSTKISEALMILRHWLDARLVGGLANIRKTQIVRSLQSAIYANLCGEDWGNTESAYIADISNTVISDKLYKKVTRNPSGFASVLEKNRSIFKDNMEEAITWYSELCARYDVCHDETLCRFAVEFACIPFAHSLLGTDEFDPLLNKARACSSVLKGVRYAVLIMMQKDEIDLVSENFGNHQWT